MLPSRAGSVSRTLPRRGCCGTGAGRTRLFPHASNHSSTAVSLTIQRPRISDAFSSPSRIARLTVRCSQRAIFATSWMVRQGLSLTLPLPARWHGPPVVGLIHK